jgi:phage shock protein C
MKGSALRGITSRQSLTYKNKIMKKLNRSNDNVIGGVCAGLGEYLNIDSTIVRLIFVGLIFCPFPIITIYLIGWIVTPKSYE